LTALAAAPVALLVTVTSASLQAATAPGADVSAMLAGLAALVGWVVSARLLVTALAVLLAALPGSCGRAGRKLAAAWSPAMLRGLVRAALGVAVATGPVLGAAAAFADLAPLPVLDRVVATPAQTTAPPASRPGHASHPTAGGHVVVVRPGDSLWAIAASHLPPGHTDAQVAAAWPRWYAANRQAVGPDPSHIEPGLRLTPPG
jgi:resuscitation-promoting factor RpfA